MLVSTAHSGLFDEAALADAVGQMTADVDFFIVDTPGGVVSCTNIGIEKSPPANISRMCAMWARIWPRLAASPGSFTVTSIGNIGGLFVTADGGKTWEVNWITDQVRVSDESGKSH